MSFVTQDDIKNLIEALLKHCWPLHVDALSLPLPRMSYTNAIQQYGSDKPDTRHGNMVKCTVILSFCVQYTCVITFCIRYVNSEKTTVINNSKHFVVPEIILTCTIST